MCLCGKLCLVAEKNFQITVIFTAWTLKNKFECQFILKIGVVTTVWHILNRKKMCFGNVLTELMCGLSTSFNRINKKIETVASEDNPDSISVICTVLCIQYFNGQNIKWGHVVSKTLNLTNMFPFQLVTCRRFVMPPWRYIIFGTWMKALYLLDLSTSTSTRSSVCLFAI